MNQQKRRFFIALVPPQPIQDYANEIKQHFAEHYASQAAQKSPPHITLQAPFEWSMDEIDTLKRSLREFAIAQTSIPISLSGFSAFVPRVIYINVSITPALLDLHQALLAHMEAALGVVDAKAKQRPFAPHMTVAFRDLTKQNFRAAWPEFQDRPVELEFVASHLTLLLHDGHRWHSYEDFPLAYSSTSTHLPMD
uniref:2'-5' RNA ligase family protein n=1 Tax=Trichocoleus desertorum TaxID=1481672 RepID=UPI0025B2DD49|nr:2'-5' RNA ligase family protein [Trichocoleus desertorum]